MSGDACGTDASAPPVLPLESAPAGLRARLESLRLKYAAAFGGEVPAVYVRVPGRVNLIGEHVDYCGYSVCPMAIQQDLLVAASPVDTGDFLRLVNLDSETYPGHDFPDRNFVIDLKLNGWSSYFLCGVKGALERMSTGCSLPNGRPNGNVPPGSGLSSSSALVSAAFLTTAYLNKMQLSKSELAALSARSEQYIGTVGGGMDQAIAFLATKGCAKHIEFEPIRTEDLSLPDDAVFVIAHSRVTKNKAATADFNTRVVECRLAAQVRKFSVQNCCVGIYE
ncbi:hypothetical protein AAG570_004781 [Ranatra chinensis]|uniref:Galactokinase n=1 Tax=Ranatra chinensis TaxID=642074 RepID=A0ABD0YQC3_9HEMI